MVSAVRSKLTEPIPSGMLMADDVQSQFNHRFIRNKNSRSVLY